MAVNNEFNQTGMHLRKDISTNFKLSCKSSENKIYRKAIIFLPTGIQMKYRWLKVISIHNSSFKFKYESHHVCRSLQVRCKKRSWTRSVDLYFWYITENVTRFQLFRGYSLTTWMIVVTQVSMLMDILTLHVCSFYLILDRYSLHNYG